MSTYSDEEISENARRIVTEARIATEIAMGVKFSDLKPLFGSSKVDTNQKNEPMPKNRPSLDEVIKCAGLTFGLVVVGSTIGSFISPAGIIAGAMIGIIIGLYPIKCWLTQCS